MSDIEPTPGADVRDDVVQQHNIFKVFTAVLAVALVAAVVSFVLLWTTKPQSTATPATDTANAYSVDLTLDAISAKTAGNKAASVLTLNDLSDSFSNKALTIGEWDLSITTKYADLLEYEYIPRAKTWKEGLTPYAACNSDYLYCDSIVAIRIKEQYVDVAKQEAIKKEAYGDTAGKYEDNPDDRTVAYIYQDNRSLSQSGSTTVRYWESKAFTTEFGTRGTLLLEATKAGGEDDLGFGLCGVELTIALGSKTPCEDIFLSLLRFDTSSSTTRE